MARGFGVTLEVKPGLKELARRFDAIAKDFDDYRPVFDELAPIVNSEVDRIIGSKGSVAGTPWPKWTPDYAKRATGKMLRRTGALIGALKVRSRTKRALRFGTRKIPYARAVGAVRSFLAVTKRMDEAFLRAADRFVGRQIAKGGFR